MHAHGIQVFDGTDDHEVVGAVAHHFKFVLFPADERFFDEHGVDRAFFQPPGHLLVELVWCEDGAGAAAAQGEAGANKERVAPDLLGDAVGIFQRAGDAAARRLQPSGGHGILEQLAIFGHLHGAQIGADQLDAVAVKHAGFGQRHGQVEARLPAHRRQQRVGPLLSDDALQNLDGERLDVGGVGHLRVGHNRGRVGVHQHDPVAFLAQRLARLRAGVVELARLADHDRPRADDEDGGDISAFGHGIAFKKQTIFNAKAQRCSDAEKRVLSVNKGSRESLFFSASLRLCAFALSSFYSSART